jgi:transposase
MPAFASATSAATKAPSAGTRRWTLPNNECSPDCSNYKIVEQLIKDLQLREQIIQQQKNDIEALHRTAIKNRQQITMLNSDKSALKNKLAAAAAKAASPAAASSSTSGTIATVANESLNSTLEHQRIGITALTTSGDDDSV